MLSIFNWRRSGSGRPGSNTDRQRRAGRQAHAVREHLSAGWSGSDRTRACAQQPKKLRSGLYVIGLRTHRPQLSFRKRRSSSRVGGQRRRSHQRGSRPVCLPCLVPVDLILAGTKCLNASLVPGPSSARRVRMSCPPLLVAFAFLLPALPFALLFSFSPSSLSSSPSSVPLVYPLCSFKHNSQHAQPQRKSPASLVCR